MNLSYITFKVLYVVYILFVPYIASYGTIFNYVLCCNYCPIRFSLDICHNNGPICCIDIIYEITNIWDYSYICPML